MLLISSLIALMILLALSSVQLAAGDCTCVASGDPHFTMCDGKTRFDWQGLGLFQLFKSDSVEVQCSNHPAFPGAPVSMIDFCRIKIVSGNCDLVIQTASSKSREIMINGVKMMVPDVESSTIDPSFNLTVKPSGDLLDIDCNADGGRIKITAGPGTFHVVAANIKKCTGMCGTCSGPQTRPKNMRSYGEGFAKVPHITGGTACVPTSASSTSSPSTAAPSTAVPTSAPTTKAIPSLPPAPIYVKPNDTFIPEHPVFESEQVMKSCVKQCLSGQDESRMKNDHVFGAFVENCIYDKAMGPGAEQVAQSNMKAYEKVVETIKSIPTLSSTGPWVNHNFTSPLQTLNILEKTVTRRPEEIAPGQGFTYELRLTRPYSSEPKADYLQMRPQRYSVFEEQTESDSESESVTTTEVIGLSNVTIAQKLKLHFDIEAPVVVLAPTAPVSTTVTNKSGRRKRIPIDEEDNPLRKPSSPKSSDSQQPFGSVPVQAATSSPPSSVQAANTSPTTSVQSATPSPTTSAQAMSPAPSPSHPPVRQVQIATIVRSRDVPASEIKTAAPAPEMPIIYQQQVMPNQAPIIHVVPAAAPVQMAPTQAVPIQAAPHAQAAPMVQASTVAPSTPIIQATPLMQAAAPAQVSLPIQIPVVAPAPASSIVVDARGTPQQQRALETQQAQQRRALHQQQEQQRNDLQNRQNAQRQMAQRPMSVIVQQQRPAVVGSMTAAAPFAGFQVASSGLSIMGQKQIIQTGTVPATQSIPAVIGTSDWSQLGGSQIQGGIASRTADSAASQTTGGAAFQAAGGSVFQTAGGATFQSGGGAIPQPGGAIPQPGGEAIPQPGGGAIPQLGGGAIPQSGGGAIPQSGGGSAFQSGGGAIPQSGGGAIPQSGGGAIPQSGGGAIPQSGVGSAVQLGGGSAFQSGGGSAFQSGGGATPQSGGGATPQSGGGATPQTGGLATPQSADGAGTQGSPQAFPGSHSSFLQSSSPNSAPNDFNEVQLAVDGPSSYSTSTPVV